MDESAFRRRRRKLRCAFEHCSGVTREVGPAGQKRRNVGNQGVEAISRGLPRCDRSAWLVHRQLVGPTGKRRARQTCVPLFFQRMGVHPLFPRSDEVGVGGTR